MNGIPAVRGEYSNFMFPGTKEVKGSKYWFFNEYPSLTEANAVVKKQHGRITHYSTRDKKPRYLWSVMVPFRYQAGGSKESLKTAYAVYSRYSGRRPK
jgi:hypothetical protein